jgi:hypothetical protein
MREFFEVGIERVPYLLDRMINESKQITKENFGTIELFQDIKNIDSFCDTIWSMEILINCNNYYHGSDLQKLVRKIVSNDKDLARKIVSEMRCENNEHLFFSYIFLDKKISPKFKEIVDEHLEKNYPELIKKEEQE